MIEVNSLTKIYGQKRAVDDLTFTVNDGEILGFLGPNGAGKTTTMNILTGYLSATSGEAKINGIEVLEDPLGVKKQIGYLPEQPPLYMDMTVKDYLNFMYELKKIKIPREMHISEICELVKIGEVYNRIIKNLSKGYKQRVGIAQALLGNPQVLILDEPTVGLDPHQIIEIRNLIKKLGKKHTVILSSHILSEVQAVCDRIIVINRGKLVADGTPESLSRELSKDHRLQIRVDGPEGDVKNILSKIGGVVKVESLGRKESGSCDFVIETNGEIDVRREVFKRLSERNYAILMFKSNELTLEDIFMRLTAGEDFKK